MENWFPVGKAGAKTTYADKASCELAEGQSCYEITGKDLDASSVVNGVVVEDSALKAKLDKDKADIAHVNRNWDILGEGGRYLLKRFQAMNDSMQAVVDRCTQHLTMSCHTVSTVGGAAIEDFLDPRVKTSMHVTATMKTLGASPVSVLSAKCEMGKVTVTFSADPSSDHELTYHVCR